MSISLEERVARLEVLVEQQSLQLDRMTQKIDDLMALANRGRGALPVLVAAGAIAGSGLLWLGERLLGLP